MATDSATSHTLKRRHRLGERASVSGWEQGKKSEKRRNGRNEMNEMNCVEKPSKMKSQFRPCHARRKHLTFRYGCERVCACVRLCMYISGDIVVHASKTHTSFVEPEARAYTVDH